MNTFEDNAVHVDIDNQELGNSLSQLIALADDALKADLSQAILYELQMDDYIDYDNEWIDHPPKVIYCNIAVPVYPKYQSRLTWPLDSATDELILKCVDTGDE